MQSAFRALLLAAFAGCVGVRAQQLPSAPAPAPDPEGRVIEAAVEETHAHQNAGGEKLQVFSGSGIDWTGPRKTTLGGGWSASSLFTSNTNAANAGSGGRWYLNEGVSVRTVGGVTLSANAIGRRASQLPLSMMQAFGADGVLAGVGLSSLDQSPQLRFDTQLRVQKRLITRRGVTLDAVGEAFNLFRTVPFTSTDVALHPRAIRFGFLLTF